MHWSIRDKQLTVGKRTLIMGVLNVTPDSFSDGGEYLLPDLAVEHARQMIDEGADIIDIGGESTRPGGGVVPPEEEMRRVIPVIEALAKEIEIPISIDTTKSVVAAAALKSGAAIVNDISALRFDFHIADEVARVGAGLVLMHSRGTPATLHRLPPVADIISEVVHGLRSSIAMAERRGVKRESIAIDAGIGFGKSRAQNVELLAKLDKIAAAYPNLPILVGTSLKSFIGHLLADESGQPAPASERVHATTASITVAILNGAHIIRVHNVKAAVQAARFADAVKRVASN